MNFVKCLDTIYERQSHNVVISHRTCLTWTWTCQSTQWSKVAPKLRKIEGLEKKKNLLTVPTLSQPFFNVKKGFKIEKIEKNYTIGHFKIFDKLYKNEIRNKLLRDIHKMRKCVARVFKLFILIFFSILLVDFINIFWLKKGFSSVKNSIYLKNYSQNNDHNYIDSHDVSSLASKWYGVFAVFESIKWGNPLVFWKYK